MYTLKSIAQRGTLLGVAAALVAATVLPATEAFADALNPLTERSLTLSSSSPGWAYTDGSNNSTYAPPNSGANGQKTGNYFDFKVSSGATVRTFSFQYCTTSAGLCAVPGNNSTPGADTATTSDLNAVFPATATNLEVGSGNFGTVINAADGKVKAVPGYTNNNPKYQAGGGTGDPAEAAKAVTGNYIVMTSTGGAWTQSTGWLISAHNVKSAGAGVTNNYIVLTKPAGQALTANTQVKVLFFANNTYYITNPGAGEYFVKINTYNKAVDLDLNSDGSEDDATTTGLHGLAPASDANIIDGGVTVANVMNQSIHITTKVLETMQFSVGTVDPNTLSSARPGETDSSGADATGTSELDDANGNLLASPKIRHQVCGTILKSLTPSQPANVLQLGNQAAESSLEVGHTYSTHSYWRLSSNSSGGATVYYSGHTLSNTSGDEIDPIGVAKEAPVRGEEQFGLALANTGDAGDTGYGADVTGPNQNFSVNYDQEATYENGNDNGKTAIHTASLTADGVIGNGSWHTPRLYPLVPAANYNNGTGAIDGANQTQFAFDALSDTVPVPIATEHTEVVDCVTGKMRYIANIAATTPAGIYTTKVNYIAAPQY